MTSNHGKMIGAAASLVFIVGCVWLFAVASETTSLRPTNKGNPMASTKTVCVGRMIIDLPEAAEYQLKGAFLDGFDIWVGKESDLQYHDRVNRRIDVLSHPDPYEASLTKPLERAAPFEVKVYKGTLLVAERFTTLTTRNGVKKESSTVTVEAYARSGDFSVDITAKFIDPGSVERPLQILAQLELNPHNLTPQEPGFCIGNAYLREPLPADQRERVTLLAGWKENPDVTLALSSTVGAEIPEDDLLLRIQKSRAATSAFDRLRITDLGQGDRIIHGLPGREVKTRYREHNHTTSYAFMWESTTVPGNVFRPALYLEFQTGINQQSGSPPVDSSLTQEAALQLWQEISASIQVRPQPTFSAQPDRVPAAVGALASAGKACLQSGWWQCSEDGGGLPIVGGRRRHFMEGEIFPQADILAPQTFWDRVKGHKTIFQSKYPTIWRLVELDS